MLVRLGLLIAILACALCAQAPDAAGMSDTLFITEDGDTLHQDELDSVQLSLAIVKVPALLDFVKAVYPPEGLKQGLEGEVFFDIFISDSGRVDSLHLLAPLSPDFDSAAASAVRQFRFSPALNGVGEAVPVIVQYLYRFSIAEEVRTVEEYVNFRGLLLEKGSRLPLRNAPVVVSFLAPGSDTSIKVPWEAYLRKISTFGRQPYEGGRLSTTTDSAGWFRFFSLPEGPIRLYFPVTGYKPDSSDEQIVRAEERDMEYRLEPLVTDEYEVVVYGRIEKQEVAKSRLSLQEVKRIPGFGGDAVKVVQALPGVARASFGSGQIIVRGSDNGDTRYFLDGIEIPLLFHFGGLRSTYNSDALSSIDLYPGGFNARYGGCIAGVVEIKGRPPASGRWHGNADVNLIDASFLAEGPLSNKWSLLITGRRSYIADVAAWAIDRAGFTLPLTVVPYYWDGVARLDYRPDSTTRFFSTLFLGKDAFKFIASEVRGGSDEVSSEENVLSQELGFQKLLLGYDRDLPGDFRNEARLAYTRNQTFFNVFGFLRLDIRSAGLYLRDELSWRMNDLFNWRAGADLQADSLRYTVGSLVSDGSEVSSQRQLYSILGIYGAFDYTPFKGFLLTPGMRYDYYNELQEGALSFRLTSRWNWRRNHTAKAALGTYNQSPEPQGQVLDPVFGNPGLPPTLARHAVLGYEWRFTDLLSIDAQGYYNDQNQIPARYSDTSAAAGRAAPKFLADERGRMYGLEIMLRHDQSRRFFGWVAYSLSRSERQSDRQPQQQGGGNSLLNVRSEWDPERWYLFERDQTHNVQVVASWKLPRNWESGFRARYVTGNPATPRLGYTDKKYEFDSELNRYNSLYGEYLSDRLGPFFQLDLRADKKWLFKQWTLSAYLDIQNANYFFYNSPETYRYNYDNSERTAVGGIILPSLGVRGEF